MISGILTKCGVAKQLHNAHVDLTLAVEIPAEELRGDEPLQVADGVRFARARLPVGEERADAAVVCPGDKGLDDIRVDLLCRGVGVEDAVDFIVVGLIEPVSKPGRTSNSEDTGR